MTVGEVTEFIERFAAASRAPVRTGTDRDVGAAYRRRVPGDAPSRRRVRLPDGGHRQRRLQPARRCRRSAAGCPASVQQVTTFDYRDPDELPDGGVLVVGASATGVQLAAELARSGRPVTLSVGEHVRLPRTYRGRDVLWWMDAPGCGTSATTSSTTSPGPGGCPRRSWSGRPSGRRSTSTRSTALGVELVGRWAAVRDGRALFSGGLRNVFSLADLKLSRLLGHVRRVGPDQRAATASSAAPERARADPGARHLAAAARPDQRRDPRDRVGDRLPARLPLAGRAGGRRQGPAAARRRRGHDSPGLYALGLPVLRRRKSTFIYGIEDDARDVIGDLAKHLAGLGAVRV